jgi:primosomal protein N'
MVAAVGDAGHDQLGNQRLHMPNDQPTLFDREPTPWDLDDQAEHLLATVVFPKGPQKPYDYLVPEALVDKIEAGRRVRAPLGAGNRSLVGYCVAVETRQVDAARYKSLKDVVDSQTLIRPALLRLTEWMSHRYLCSWSQALEAIVPAGVRAEQARESRSICRCRRRWRRGWQALSCRRSKSMHYER